MKLFIVLCAMVAASFAVPTVKYNEKLMADFNEFNKCVNVNQTVKDIQDAIQNNDAVKKIIAYLQTDGFKKAVEGIDAEKSYLAILDDLEDQGLPAYEGVNDVLKALGITPIPVPPTQAVNDGTLDDLFDKLEKDVDFDCTDKTYKELLKTKLEFKAFDTHLHRQEFKDLVTKFKESEGLKKAVEEFHQHGLDLSRMGALLNKIYHWDF